MNAAPGDEAPDRVAVPAEVLRGAVHDGVDAEVEGPLVDGRCERVVADRGDARLPRDGADGRQVAQRQQGIARRLQVDEPGVGPDGPLDVRRVSSIDKRRLDAQRSQLGHHEVIRARVDRVRRHDVVAGLDRGEDRRGDGRHAARRGGRRLRVLEGRGLALEGRNGRVAPARVDVRRLLSRKDGCAVLRRAQVIGGGQVQRRHERPGGGVRRLPGMNGGGLQAHRSRGIGHRRVLQSPE